MRKETVVFITTDYPPQTGGISSLGYALVDKLMKRFSTIVIDREKEEYYKLGNVLYYKTPKDILKYLKDIKTKRDLKYVIIFHWEPFNYLPLFLFLIKNKIPYILWVHGKKDFLRKRSLYTELKKRALARCSHRINVLSPYIKEELKKMGIKEKKIRIVSPFIDKEKIKKASKEDVEKIKRRYKIKTQKVILSIGRLEKGKGYETSIKAMRLLKKDKPDFIYVIVGDGIEKAKILETIKKENLEENILLVGALSEDPKDKKLLSIWYSIADLFLLPSEEEGFGLVYIEADKHGLPIIGSNTTGARYALSKVKKGYAIDPKDENKIYQKIKEVLF